MNSKLQILPPAADLETLAIYEILNKASRGLGELKGESKIIPNEDILINTMTLQEAKNSSAIENIITTDDELFRVDAGEIIANSKSKEVKNYADALKDGFALVRKNRLLTNNNILDIQKKIEPSKYGFRKLPGTVLQNNLGKAIYTPPQNANEILKLMSNLEKYINDSSMDSIDPLIKMAIIHYQFESIHPFYDGNGRTGRIINILYLVQQQLLDFPILYLSKYIIENKSDYYRLLQKVRTDNDWESWIVWMLKGVEEISKYTINIVIGITKLMADYKYRIKGKYKFYSQDLINNLFKHPYTKIEFIARDLRVTRRTASFYLTKLTKDNFLDKIKISRSNYYINPELLFLLTGKRELDISKMGKMI
ncbi:MAG: Fic family protein [Candidatus Marinimicrobia bacterium]|nr:Fic family protein [Candidatus Neomarinimicrobiota bacterium]